MVQDGWSGEESQLNKIGTSIAVLPAVIGALLLWQIIPVEIPIPVLFAVVAICGIVGGIMNIYGRGPIAAGAVVGLVLSLGGFGAVFLWINKRGEHARWFEVALAFMVGAMPGFLLQYVIQRMVGARAEAAPVKRVVAKPGVKPMRRV